MAFIAGEEQHSTHAAPAGGFAAVARRPWAAASLAAFLVTLATIALEWQSFTLTGPLRLMDGDDALRLVQVRDLLAGGSWFDPVIATLGESPGLASHWSRLIDAGVGGLQLGLRPFVGAEHAERLSVMLWPKLVLFGFVAAFARCILREGGLAAALALTGLLAMSVVALLQFRVFRIDHHNAQNACAALAIVLATMPGVRRNQAAAAGAIAGLGLTIGFEALPIVALLGALLALAALLNPERSGVAEAFAAGLAAALAAGFAATVPPSRWLDMPCDALGANVVLSALAGCGGLMLARLGDGRRTSGAFMLAAAAAAAFAIFALLEPRCLSGPFGKMDPAIGPLIFDEMSEAGSLVALSRTAPALAVSLALTLVGFAAIQLRSALRERSAEAAMRTVILLALCILAARYFKMTPYAHLLGIYLAALAIPRFRGFAGVLPGKAAGALAMVALSPACTTAVVAAAFPMAAPATAAAVAARCDDPSLFEGIAALPPSRVLAQPDLGAHLTLFTQHRVLIGNYHRLDSEIIRSRSVLHAPVGEAHALLRAWSIDAIAVCRGGKFFHAPAPVGSLAAALEAAQGGIAYLELLPQPAAGALLIYRVKP